MRTLTGYQVSAARAVFDSVLEDRGLVFTIESEAPFGSRQLSAHLETLLLGLHAQRGARLLKIAPTDEALGRTQLAEVLNAATPEGFWEMDRGVVRLGRAEVLYTTPHSAEYVPGAIGLVEVAEAHLMSPFAIANAVATARSNQATTVLYGTCRREDSAFGQWVLQNQELQTHMSSQLHFSIGFNREPIQATRTLR